MRNSKLAKLITAILALMLLVGSVAMITAFAEEEASVASARVVTENLNYASRTEIVFGVKAENLGEKDTLVMLFWNEAQEEYTYLNASYRKLAYAIETIEDVECHLFVSKGIVPAKINDNIYVCPTIRTEAGVVDGKMTYNYTYGEVTHYNIGMYAAEKLTEVDNTEAQVNLYFSLLDYADAAAAKFGGAGEVGYTIVQSTDNLGSFGGFGAKYAVPDKDGNVTVRAEARNADGQFFIKWVDAEGNTVLANRVGKVAVTEKGFVDLTPVYGAQSESAYTTALNIESFDNGEIMWATPDLSKAPDKVGYDAFAGTALRLWQVKDEQLKSSKKLTFTYYAAPLYDTITEGKEKSQWYAPIVNENGEYTLLSREQVYVVENEANGDKELLVDRNDVIANGWVFYYEQRSEKSNAAEVDITFKTMNTKGTGLYFTMATRNASTYSSRASAALRTNLQYVEGKGFALAADGTSPAIYATANGEVQYFDVKAGETFTLTVRLNLHEATEEDPATLGNTMVDYYINGEYLGSIAIEAFKSFVTSYNKAIPADKPNDKPYDLTKLYAYDLYVGGITALVDDVVIDNLGHLK